MTPDDDPPMANLPLWARVIGIVGVPSGLAIYLVVVLTTGIMNTQRELVQQLNDFRLESANQRSSLRVDVEAHRRSTESAQAALQRYLRVICQNTASSAAERQNCVSAEP